MSERIVMTKEGYEAIKADKEELQAKVPEIKRQIKEAREKGDLRENADYHAAREELGMVNAKIGHLEGQLAMAEIMDTSKAPDGVAVMGRTVKFKRLKDGKILERTLVGAGQADPVGGKILCDSPLGAALAGSHVGETVTAELPNGGMELEILEIN